jgi:hypothetical protein
MKTKNELEQAIVMHEEALASSQHSVIVDTQDLELAKKELADINKPELTPLQFDNLYEAVEQGVSGYDFSDTDNYDKDFGIDYDGRVTLESFDISNSQDLVEAVVAEVSKLFTEKSEDDQVNTHTVVEKLI